MSEGMGIRLVETCEACPEQYDAYMGDKLIGYLRLRHGHFTVRYPGVMGKLVYEANPKGDGIFEDDERKFYLDKAIKALAKAHKENN